MDLLPDDVGDLILLSVRDDVTRCRLASTCRSMLAAHLRHPYTNVKCSMHCLTKRGRDAHVPHWTHDMTLLAIALQRTLLRSVVCLRVCLDTPCFDSRGGRGAALVAPNVWHAIFVHTRSLVIDAAQRHYATPSASAITYLLRAFPVLTSIGLCGIHNIGTCTLDNLFSAQRQTLGTLTLRECKLTAPAQRSMAFRLTSSTAQWPPNLTTLRFAASMRQVVHLCGGAPLCFPISLRVLDVHDCVGALSTMQLHFILRYQRALHTLCVPIGYEQYVAHLVCSTHTAPGFAVQIVMTHPSS